MVVSKRWQTGAMLFAGLLALNGCSDSSSGTKGNPDGGADTDGGSTGSSTGSSTGNENNQLDPKTVGKKCESNDDCAGSGAECVDSFTPGGDLGALIPGNEGAEAPGGYCTADCDDDAQCGEDGVCAGAFSLLGNTLTSGLCQKACSADGDCRDGYVCTTLTENIEDLEELLPADPNAAGGEGEGGSLLSMLPFDITIPTTCQPIPKPANLNDGVAGKACEEDGNCGGDVGECLKMTGGFVGDPTVFEGGYCTGNCTEDSHCGDGGVCVGTLNRLLPGSCYQGCSVDADCSRDGYRCLPAIPGDAESTRRCYPAADPLPEDVAGSTCAADEDCAHGVCDLEIDGGLCTIECVQDTDCGPGGACVLGYGCAAGCDTTADCTREGYECVTQGQGDFTASSYCQAADEALTCDPACGDNATCDTSGDTPTCMCDEGYEGDAVAGCTEIMEPTCDPACGDNASCDASGDTPVCMCDEGFGNMDQDGNCTAI